MSSNATVYGGDEINAVVLDPGSLHTRIGYAGDDFPKIITPLYYGQDTNNTKKALFGDAMELPRAGFEVRPILKDTVITDWEGALAQYHHYFDDVLHLDYQEQPLLVTEPVWTTQEYRQTLVESFYESFQFPALYLAKAPTCVSFQQGRPNCLVVDVGHDSVSVTPVIDGICLLKNSMRTHYAGKFLEDQIVDTLDHKFPGLSLINKFRVRDKTGTVYPEKAQFVEKKVVDGITASFEDFQRQYYLREFKEGLLEVPEKKLNVNNTQQAALLKDFYLQEGNRRRFELPLGQLVEVSIERHQLADALFDPASYTFHNEALAEKYPMENGELSIKGAYDDYRPLKRAKKAELNTSTPPPADKKENKGAQVRGISALITHALSQVDIDLRTSVAHNIIVTGGVSLIPQLTERLYYELLNANPGLKIRLHATGNANERNNQTWIGGSVLASLGTFHQMWVSKAEYEEAGADRILTQRFR